MGGQTDGELWALDAGGVPHPIKVDRCDVLRSQISQLNAADRKAFGEACPRWQKKL